MHYKISSLPFPSVTLCPNDRVDWNRALELERKIFPNDTDSTSLKTYRRILGRLSMMSYGDFDELEFLRNENRSINVLSGRIPRDFPSIGFSDTNETMFLIFSIA